jgi:hypothetical protein
MNRAESHPWLLAVVFGIIFGIAFWFYCFEITSSIGLGEVGHKSVWWSYRGAMYFRPSPFSTLFIIISFISLICASASSLRDDSSWGILGVIELGILSFIVVLLDQGAATASGNSGNIAFVESGGNLMNCIIVGVYLAAIGTIVSGDFSIGIPAYLIGLICGIFVPWNYVNFPFFASIGYVIGKPIEKWAEQRAERNKIVKAERDGRRRVEAEEKAEYRQKISRYKAQLEQWERGGYNVTELKRRWFK